MALHAAAAAFGRLRWRTRVFVALPLVGIACSSSAALAAPPAAIGVVVALPLVAGWGGGGRWGMQKQQKKQIPFGDESKGIE